MHGQVVEHTIPQFDVFSGDKLPLNGVPELRKRQVINVILVVACSKVPVVRSVTHLASFESHSRTYDWCVCRK